MQPSIKIFNFGNSYMLDNYNFDSFTWERPQTCQWNTEVIKNSIYCLVSYSGKPTLTYLIETQI